MDQETHETKAIVGNLGQSNQGTSETSSADSSNSDNRIVLENPSVPNLGERVSARRENRDFDANMNRLDLAKRVGDKEASNGKGIGEPLDEGTSRNSLNFVDEVVLERMIVINSGEIVSIGGANKDSARKIDEPRLNGRDIQRRDQEAFVTQRNSEALHKVEQESLRVSSISIDGVVLETVIIVNSEENIAIREGNEQSQVKSCGLESSKVMMDKSKTQVCKEKKQSCVIDMKCPSGGGGSHKDGDGERVCRICHLGAEGLAETTETTASMDLIQLGCVCKDELGIAHAYCAEAWFKLKGNR